MKYIPGIVCEICDIRFWEDGTVKLLLVTDGYIKQLCRVPKGLNLDQACDLVMGQNFLDL